MNTEKETPEIETNDASTNGDPGASNPGASSAQDSGPAHGEGTRTTSGAPASASETAEEKLARLESEADSFRDKWIRAEADLQNYKKRSDQERDELRRFAGGALIINLLPIVDDFERAFKSLDISLSGMTWFDGIQLIYRKLLMLLDNAGVKPIQSEGQDFDPKVHEAVAHVPGEEGKVVAEVQRGYMLHDRVLRPAMVAVGNGEETKDTNKGDPAA